MINIKLTKSDFHTLNNILSHLIKNEIEYNKSDVLAVLEKVKRTAKMNNIDLIDWN